MIYLIALIWKNTDSTQLAIIAVEYGRKHINHA